MNDLQIQSKYTKKIIKTLKLVQSRKERLHDLKKWVWANWPSSYALEYDFTGFDISHIAYNHTIHV